MRRLHRWPVLMFGFLLISSFAYAQSIELPDYAGWTKGSGKADAVLNGQDVTLSLEGYEKVDKESLTLHRINLIYDPHGNLWLAAWWEQVWERNPDGSNTARVIQDNHYLFINENGKWLLVKDFSKSTHPGGALVELVEYLRDQYKLVFKQQV